MEFEINILLWVDTSATFLEVDEDYSSSVEELVRSVLYDVDDIKVKVCEVEKSKY